MTSLIEEEFDSITRDRSWQLVYNRIKNEATILHTFSTTVARLPENRDKNRYRDVSPYDEHRVKLDGLENDYINASVVKVPLAKRSYLLTQGPLPHTSGHFWLMVWQQNSAGIIMLNRIMEQGRLKCHPYFPFGSECGGEDQMVYPDVGMEVTIESTEDFSYFVRRTFKLVNTKTGADRLITQYHYIAWPDFDVPQSTDLFLSFLYIVRESGVLSSAVGPCAVHCSAGIGRSGTFCLVDSALVLVERTKSLAGLDVRSMLMDMRQYRGGLIQTHEQLRFSYMAIIDGGRRIIEQHHLEQAEITASTDTGMQDSSGEDNSTDEDVDNLTKYQTGETIMETNDSYKGHSGADVLNNPQEPHDAGPEPPKRSSSLHDNSDAPKPPSRTSSLAKAASLDEATTPPPPLPPRPQPPFSRQVSAPVTASKEGATYKSEPVLSPIKIKRDERKKHTQEMIAKMKAKQQEAELFQKRGSSLPYWLGAAGVSLLGIAYLYWKNA